MSTTDAPLSPTSARPPVLILCAADALTKALVRELAGRGYQPLVSRPGWTCTAALEWARPVAVVIDADQAPVASDATVVIATDARVAGRAVDAAVRRTAT